MGNASCLQLPETCVTACAPKVSPGKQHIFVTPLHSLSFHPLYLAVTTSCTIFFSHSSRSLTMRFYRQRCDDTLPAAGETPSASDWLKVRRFYIYNLRYQTKSTILLLALSEALKKGPLELVYAGRQDFPPPGENDYGVSRPFLHPWDSGKELEDSSS